MLVYSWKSRVMPSHSPVFASVYMFSVSSPPSSFSSLSSLSSFTGCSTINHHCFYCTRSQSSRGIVFTNFFIVLNFISFFVLLTFTTVFLLVIIFITLYIYFFYCTRYWPLHFTVIFTLLICFTYFIIVITNFISFFFITLFCLVLLLSQYRSLFPLYS